MLIKLWDVSLVLYVRKGVYNKTFLGTLTTEKGLSYGVLIILEGYFRLLRPKLTRRNYPLLVSVPELVSALKSVITNGLDYSHQYPTPSLTYRQYAMTSRHNLSLESCRRCPKADNFHFWAYIPRYASKEKEAKENDNYVIQLNARSFHVIEKGKMTNLTGVCIMTLTVLTSRLMTYSKLRLYLTYMHSLNYHW